MITPTVDLEIHVTTQVVEGRTRLSYELHSAKLGYRGRRIPGPEIKTQPEDYQVRLLGKMESLNKHIGPDASLLDSAEVEQVLESLGRELYRELFSPELCEAYRDFRENVKTLLIVSDEPWIPWELVKPEESREGEVLFNDEFLCWHFELSRWFLAGDAPPAEIGVTRAVCIEAGNPRNVKPLKHAKAESRFVVKLAKRKSVKRHSLADATFEDAKSALERGGNGWIHFVGHGKHQQDDPYGSQLLMTDGRSLCPRDVDAVMESQLQQDRPLVFFNSCQVGQQSYALTGLGGWASTLAKARCGAFVAPQWSVDDKSAFAFAKTFYRALADGETIAKATRMARARVRDDFPGLPTWLAYSLYGHPDAKLSFGKVPPPTPSSFLKVMAVVALALAVVLGVVWLRAGLGEDPADCILSAEAQLSSGDPDKTLEIVRRCRRLTDSPRDEARLALISADAYHALEDSERALESARDAAVRAEEALDFFTVGRARFMEALILIELKELDGAAEKLEQTKLVFEQLDDPSRVADTVFHLGLIAHQQGRLSEAWDFYEEAAGFYQELGEDHHLATALNRLGELLSLTGSPEEARQLTEAALAIHAETGPEEVPYDRLRLGEALAALDRDAEARSNLESACGGLKGRGASYGEALLALARLELGPENFGDAISLASEAAKELLEVRETELAILAETVQVRALLASGSDGSEAREIYNRIRMHTPFDGLSRARLEAELLGVLWDAQDGQLEDTDFKPLLDAAESAAQEGYLQAVDAARRELEGLSKPEVAAQLETLLETARRSWTLRQRRVLALQPL